jgi:hypothetical protein
MKSPALIKAYKAAKAEYEEHNRTDHIEYKKICQWLVKYGKEKR